MKINELLLNRESPRSFDSNYIISNEDILTITEAMRLSPSAYGLLSWRTLVIKRSSKFREELLPLFYNQKNVTEASAIVLIIVSEFDKLIEKDIPQYVSLMDDNTSDRVKNYEKRMLSDINYAKVDPYYVNWTSKEAFIAMGASLAVAEELGIDLCPIDGVNKKKIKEYLFENKLIEANEKFGSSVILGKRNIDVPKKKKIRLDKKEFTKIHD
ncbi:hypothetical protein STIUS_v1c02030 [Spiroplasma sp. TIUS-1]|uniref:nitroreductase family protein n=1 Tax=Spiroplasma sp. TIUS-1 TaxID=216963 RepID=UPI001399122D|nr:nitroreductase family protein [Spiroplasma sp. TIUS-1]QHX35758.1 hypothetical protein STIUS_v1c02030 [Spiroplasma sp. TIUS-1]